MDAYVLGTHEGDLPTSLVGAGDEGNRIRAAAKLQGADQNVFYALQVESADDVQPHVDAIIASGTSPIAILTAGSEAATLLIVPHHPAYLPPGLWTAFVHVVGEGADRAVEVLLELLGEERVAAARLDDGSVLVEATGDDRDELADAIDRATAEATVTEQVRGFAAQDEFHRAT